MQRRQAFKYELMPDGDTQRQLRRFAGSCRFVYNKALALQKDNHEAGEKFIGYVAMAARLPLWKREVGQEWLKSQKIIARRRHGLRVWNAAMKITPITSARSTF